MAIRAACKLSLGHSPQFPGGNFFGLSSPTGHGTIGEQWREPTYLRL